jgi:hypothetical protein
MLLREAVQSLKTRVDAACEPINPWLKPFDCRMFYLMMCWLGLLGPVFVNMQVKFEPERPQCQAGWPESSPKLAKLRTVSF